MDIITLTTLSSAIEALAVKFADPSMDNVENDEVFQREARFKAAHDSATYSVKYTELFLPDGNNEIKVTASIHSGKEQQSWSLTAHVSPEDDGSQVLDAQSECMGMPIEPLDGVREIKGIVQVGEGVVVGV